MVGQIEPITQLENVTKLNNALDHLSAKLLAHLHPESNTQRMDHGFNDSLEWQGYVFRCR